MAKCDTCWGHGGSECAGCDGEGRVAAMTSPPFLKHRLRTVNPDAFTYGGWQVVTCEYCHGTGQLVCRECQGTGVRP